MSNSKLEDSGATPDVRAKINFHLEVIKGKPYLVLTGVNVPLWYKYKETIKRLCGLECLNWSYGV